VGNEGAWGHRKTIGRYLRSKVTKGSDRVAWGDIQKTKGIVASTGDEI